MKATTADRLKEVMKRYELRQVDILKRAEPYCKKHGIKMGRNDLSQYVSGKVSPGQEKLTILALALDVSESWLMGYDVPMERIDYQAIEKHKEEMFEYAKRWNIQYYEKELLKSFTQLSDSNKKKSIGYTEKLLQIQNMESEQQEHLIPNAAHERTDIVINEEDRLEDERMMADDGD